MSAESNKILPAELHLKNQSERELYKSLFVFSKDWNFREKGLVEDAYFIVKELFKNDIYKGDKYVMHLLRAANRVAGYLELPEWELVVGALHHDTPEDHAEELVLLTRYFEPDYADEKGMQSLALCSLGERYSLRVEHMVEAVTNPSDLSKKNYSEEEFLYRYSEKVKEGVKSPEGWVLKFADWCDNGLGMAFSELPKNANELLSDKYGRAMVHLVERYEKLDIQLLLSPSAHSYVSQQFDLGMQRLNL